MSDFLTKICSLLNKHGVEYLVIGGVAVIYHGYTRSTADIDFWYNPTLTNFHRIINAFKEYGIDVSELEKEVFDPAKSFLRFPTPDLRTDFLPVIPGHVSFAKARSKAEVLTLGSVDIYIIGYDDLIENKRSTNRTKDLADIEELSRRKGNDADKGL